MNGAFEYLPKPFDLEALKLVVWKALNSEEEARTNSEPNSNVGETTSYHLSALPAMQKFIGYGEAYEHGINGYRFQVNQALAKSL